ncbi:9d1fa01f-c692-44de-82c9-b422335780b7 [Sclerotinia trifoliorum]|uniref:Geranylgeranyl transferase type-1 subunit beta n=1 Tax=Sclerotinia trifoliorum TaxID=28548 RepID=A0A8H2VZX0_9HELO|nr:9d1fa01f-c692-44de-82c9-b422335780b7 [Sclerotinia trifoliorum]
MGEPQLEVAKHIKYWQRCLKSLLPTAYTSTDSTRMTLAFFILSALDLLNVGPSTFPESQRRSIRAGILKCQHPFGGFCGSTNHRFPDIYYADVGQGKRDVDPANLAATFFAILSLGFVGGLVDVKRRECLRWMKRLQREDGSFGEFVTEDGKIQGGRDMRYCYVATAIRWILTEDAHEEMGDDDIDVEKLVEHLRAGQTYDGGISESAQHEAHAGYTYCAIASLSLLNRLPKLPSSQPTDFSNSNPTLPGLTNLPETIRWLALRQTSYDEEKKGNGDNHKEAAPDHYFVPDVDSTFVGFNGRCNKRVDTCYCFWVGASLNMLGHRNVINRDGSRKFLFEKTQHMIGGFGKTPGDLPDIYHSYLGLAALAVLKEPGIKELDSALCISMDAKKNIEELRKAALVPYRTYWLHGYSFKVREDSPEFGEKMAMNEGPPKSLIDAFEVVKIAA